MRKTGQWKWQHGAAVAAFVALVGMNPVGAQAACVGDCDGGGEVTVDEIIRMVNISLEVAPLSECRAGDANGDGSITVDEIIQAVNNALNGCPVVTEGVCGDGKVDAGEDCDDGGLCVGGSNAGAACTSQSDCIGNGVCTDGDKIGTSCASDADCPGAECIRCRPNGGDGCAANCTSETNVPFDLIPGVVQGLGIRPGTSGAVVNGDPLTIPLPMTGTQTLVIGKQKDGVIPFVIPAASVVFPQIPVSTLACACVRGVPIKTCGGTVFDADGSITDSCTEGFSGAKACPADKPCAYVHSPGISASGKIGCNGISGINVSLVQNAQGEPGVPASPVEYTIEGEGPAGSIRFLNSVSIGTSVGKCTPEFCSDADPADKRGTPQTLPFTTGTACASILEANDDPDFDIGPVCATGAPASCEKLSATPPNVSGLSVVGSFPAADQETTGDIAIVVQFFGQ